MSINYKEYPANWLTEIRPRILERTNNCCEFCGVENYSLYPKTGSKVVLSIAHLDHDKDNHEVKDERLAALCQACHLKYDSGRHIENRKFGRNFRKNQLNLF